MAVRGKNGQVRGVFTADFGLNSIEHFLDEIKIGKTGQAYIINSHTQQRIAQPRTNKLPEGAVTAAIANLPQPLSELRPGEPKWIEFELEGQKFAAAFEAIPLGQDIHWVAAVIVPQRELLGKVWQNTAWTIAIGALSLLAALVLGNVLSMRFIRPLQRISEDLERIGQFDLSSEEPPQTQVREIQIVGESAERMKTSLRSFARYVPTDLVRQLLARGEEARLGARPEVLTICFIDIEGFSKISERTEPKELVESLGVYFDAVSNLLIAHGATLDKFIGDGLLAFFNAPNPIPEHPANACQAALAVQHTLL
jgi:adenylate cyclase